MTALAVALLAFLGLYEHVLQGPAGYTVRLVICVVAITLALASLWRHTA